MGLILLIVGGLFVVARAKKEPPRTLDLTKTKFSVHFPPELVAAGAKPPPVSAGLTPQQASDILKTGRDFLSSFGSTTIPSVDHDTPTIEDEPEDFSGGESSDSSSDFVTW